MPEALCGVSLISGIICFFWVPFNEFTKLPPRYNFPFVFIWQNADGNMVIEEIEKFFFCKV